MTCPSADKHPRGPARTGLGEAKDKDGEGSMPTRQWARRSHYVEIRSRSEGGASERAGGCGSGQMSVRKKKLQHPLPLPSSGCAKLLIKSDKLKNEPKYPMMSMILSGLSASLVLALYYFQQDKAVEKC